MFDDEYLRRLREQQEQFRRMTGGIDFSAFESLRTENLLGAGIADQLRSSSMLATLGAAAEQLRDFGTAKSTIGSAAQQLKDLGFGFSDRLSAQYLPIRDLATQLSPASNSRRSRI